MDALNWPPVKNKVIAAGHVCLDITPVFPDACAGRKAENWFWPGKLIHTEGCDVHTGGSVANTGLALKKMGQDVLLMGKTGTDAFGDLLGNLLCPEGTEGLIRDPASPTSYTVILAPPGVDRMFLHSPGANDTFSEEDISDAALAQSRLIHFGYPPLMKNMMKDHGAQLKKLFERAERCGCASSLDMAAVDPVSEEGRTDWRAWLENCMPVTDFFLPSFEEILFMLNREKYDLLCRMGGDMTDRIDMKKDVLPLAEELIGMGAACTVIKCGVKGMLMMSGSAERMKRVPGGLTDHPCWADRCLFRPCIRADKVLSATGAGDTAIAAFLCGVLDGKGPENSLFLAAAQGACCVTAWDAISALLTADQLEARYAAEKGNLFEMA